MLTLLPPWMFQYYALQILETVIKTRWKILPRNQCEGKSLKGFDPSQDVRVLSVSAHFEMLWLRSICTWSTPFCSTDSHPLRHYALLSSFTLERTPQKHTLLNLKKGHFSLSLVFKVRLSWMLVGCTDTGGLSVFSLPLWKLLNRVR